jgi:hypothetical protein
VEAGGRIGVVTRWKSVPGTQTMYNLEVTQYHTFLVGTDQWVVHNTCGGGQGEIESQFPGDYLAHSKSPNQVTPGISSLRNVYLDSAGAYEYSVVSYDEYGRVIGRTDVEPGLFDKDPIHYHTYGPVLGRTTGGGYPAMEGWGETGSHIPGIFDPFDQ